VTKPKICPYNLKLQWSISHFFTDLKALKVTIESFSPDYSEAYEKVMTGNKLTGYNMFVGRRDFLDGYCNWLFKILGELEKKINISSYDPYVANNFPDIARVFAYLGERLLPVYIEKHRLKVKCVPILHVVDSWKNNSWIVYFLFYIRDMICYYLLESPQKIKIFLKQVKKIFKKFKKKNRKNILTIIK
jgi:hypothetical protein